MGEMSCDIPLIQCPSWPLSNRSRVVANPPIIYWPVIMCLMTINSTGQFRILAKQWDCLTIPLAQPQVGKWTLVIIHSLAPGRCGCILKLLIFKPIPRIDIFNISHEISLRWMPQDITDGKSSLVQVMACCLAAPSHYLSQCWPRSMSPFGVNRPQWVDQLILA